MARVAEDLVSGLISKGVEKIASRKNLTSQDLTVLLLHEQGKSISRMEKGMEGIERGVEGLERGVEGLERGVVALKKGVEGIESGMNGLVGEFREFRQELFPLINQAKDIAEIRARMERIESKLT
jgi:archaellum component FlaC